MAKHKFWQKSNFGKRLILARRQFLAKSQLWPNANFDLTLIFVKRKNCPYANFCQTKILKWCLNWNVTKTVMLPKLKCYQNWYAIKTEISHLFSSSFLFGFLGFVLFFLVYCLRCLDMEGIMTTMIHSVNSISILNKINQDQTRDN